MKIIKANRLEQATKEIENLSPNLLKGLNTNINVKEKDYFHVLLVQVKPVKGQLQANVRSFTQVYNTIAFEALKKNYTEQNIDYIFVLHNPKMEMDTEVKDLKAIEKQKESIADKKRIEELEAKLAEKEAQESEGEIDNIVFDVEKASFKELGEYAQANNIDLKGNKSTVDMRAFLKNHLLNK